MGGCGHGATAVRGTALLVESQIIFDLILTAHLLYGYISNRAPVVEFI